MTQSLAERRSVVETTSLVDLLDRVIGTGVVVSGDIVISLAGVDLILLRLRAVLTTAYGDRWTSSTE